MGTLEGMQVSGVQCGARGPRVPQVPQLSVVGTLSQVHRGALEQWGHSGAMGHLPDQEMIWGDMLGPNV